MKKLYFLAILSLAFFGIANAQIVQKTDINTSGDSGIGSPTAFEGGLYFEADDGSSIADELYKIAADGTVSLVKDINTDPADTSPNGDPKNFIEYKSLLYFNANDGDVSADKHDNELWATDGTSEGTVLVADVWAGGDGNASNPQQMFVFNEKLYFQAKGSSSSVQFWRYNGIDAPVQITSIRDDGFAIPMNACVDEANGKTYFKVSNGAFELGVLNADESYQVIDVNPGTGNTDHGFAGTDAGVIYKDKFYFDGDNGTDGDELFVSDGTEVGTYMLKDIYTDGDSDPEGFTIYNDELYFFADVATGMQLWKTDGTEVGTIMVAEPFVGGDADMDFLTLYNGKLYFSATDGTNGIEIWSYDGTAAAMLKDIDGTSADSDPKGFTEVDGLLFFVANDGSGDKLWITNGEAEGTVSVETLFAETETPLAVSSLEFAVIGSKLYFTGDDANGFDDIYVLDVKSIYSQVTDINKDGDSGIGSPTAFKGELYFEADDGSGIADELYKIAADGNVSLVKDINTDALDTSPNGDPKNFIEYNDLLYFNANDGDKGADKHDNELWATDGTSEGTVLVADIWAGGDGNASNPQQMFVFNEKLYFQAKGSSSSVQFWRYNGIDAPVQITSIRDDGFAIPMNACVDEANGKTYFKVSNGAFELGVLNADESYQVIDVNPGTGNTDHGFAGTDAGVIYKDKFYFDGDNGTDGDELFVSDGIEAGTFMLKDIYPGGDSDPEGFTIYKDELYFIAEVATGMQLWKTDATTEGTVMVAEPFSGGDADIDHLTLYNGKLYFSATDGTNGIEIWTYDGAAAAMLKDIDGTSADSDPKGFTEVDGLLFFAANDGSGDKLWVSNGEADFTMSVEEALNSTYSAPIGVSYLEFASIGTILYYTADDANGFDDIYSVDASKIFPEELVYSVTFNVSDGTNPLEGAVVTFNGTDMTTDATGTVVFTNVAPGTGLAYSVTLDYHYYDIDATIDVDGDEFVNVVMSLDLTAVDNKPVSMVNVYPNPTKGLINITGVPDGAIYELYNLSSQKITEGILNGNQLELNVKSGIYLLRIVTEEKTFSHRLVIQ